MRHTSSWKLFLKKTVIRSSFPRLPLPFTLHNSSHLPISIFFAVGSVHIPHKFISSPPLASTRISGNRTNTRYVPTPMPKLSSSPFFWIVSPLEHFSLRGMDSASGPGILSIVSCVGYARSWISPLGLFSKQTLTTPKVGEVGYVPVSFRDPNQSQYGSHSETQTNPNMGRVPKERVWEKDWVCSLCACTQTRFGTKFKG